MTSSEGLSLSQVVQILTNFAPLSLAESWDNVGLLIEPRKPKHVTKAFLTIDLTEDVMEEALATGADFIIAYHPPIFDAVKKFISEKWQFRVLSACIENKIAVYSPHTTWDVAKEGLTDWLASPFEFAELRPIQHAKSFEPTNNSLEYLVTAWTEFPFASKMCALLETMSIDLASKLHVETDQRVTFYTSKNRLAEIVETFSNMAIRYDIIKREPVPIIGCGMGRVGKLKKPLTLQEVVNLVKTFLNMTHLRLAPARGKTIDSTVETIALVAGSGGSALRGVKADLFITGEMLHHNILEGNHSGTSVLLINHSDSERGFLTHIAPSLRKMFNNKLEVYVSKMDKDPITFV